jgi:hypothetical protein
MDSSVSTIVGGSSESKLTGGAACIFTGSTSFSDVDIKTSFYHAISFYFFGICLTQPKQLDQSNHHTL